MKTRIDYNDIVDLTCTNNDKAVKGEILDFKPAYMLTVSIDRKVKLVLRYNTEKKLYIGNVGALEFITQGPSQTKTVEGRRG